MSKLDKDIHQKEMAIRYCLINEMVPFLEVNIKNYRELSDISTLITDIDVLGIKVEPSGRQHKVIFDCKTLGKTSPINRAFWASGLMQFTDCSEAFVILRKKASEAHRLSSKQIGVHLFDERQFSNYAESCSLNFQSDYCYSTSISNWTDLYSSAVGNTKLEQFFLFLNSDLPAEKDITKVFRKFLVGLEKVKGELDPDKAKHKAIFNYSLSIFMYLMAKIIHDFRAVIDYEVSEKDYGTLMKYYIWGGRDSFLLKNKMIEVFSNSANSSVTPEPEIKSWSSYLELSRKLLDSPSDIQKCVFPIREISFMNIASRSDDKDRFVSTYVSNNKRVRQFSSSAARYLVEAVKLPKDFSTQLDSTFDKIRGI
jgi:hypothetical protein